MAASAYIAEDLNLPFLDVEINFNIHFSLITNLQMQLLSDLQAW
jgi:hypothetical protein